MAIVPFEYVPHYVIFRFKEEWWRRIVGSTDQAEAFVEQENNHISRTINKNELVVLNKSDLKKNGLVHAFIIEEFNLNAE